MLELLAEVGEVPRARNLRGEVAAFELELRRSSACPPPGIRADKPLTNTGALFRGITIEV